MTTFASNYAILVCVESETREAFDIMELASTHLDTAIAVIVLFSLHQGTYRKTTGVDAAIDSLGVQGLGGRIIGFDN